MQIVLRYLCHDTYNLVYVKKVDRLSKLASLNGDRASYTASYKQVEMFK